MFAEQRFQHLLKGLQLLGERRGMHVVLVGHVQMEKRTNSALDEWQAMGINLHKRLAPLVMHWATEAFYAHREEIVVEEEGGFRARKKGLTTGRRLLGCEETSGYDAKCRIKGLPYVTGTGGACIDMTMDARNFWDVVEGRPVPATPNEGND